MARIEQLQQEIWGLTERETVPAIELWIAVKSGNHLLGAFADGCLVGFAYGVFGRESGGWSVHSHMVGVLPKRRDRQIGFHLKVAQRERALAEGVRRITWTFDPLRSRNAHLNFKKLGVICDDYRADFYPGTGSKVIDVVGSDRLWVTWHLGSDRVRHRLLGDGSPAYSLGDATSMVWQNDDLSPGYDHALLDVASPPCLSIAIPADIDLLKVQKSIEVVARWRIVTRLAFSRALSAGYVVDDFFRPCESSHCGAFTLLSPSVSWSCR